VFGLPEQDPPSDHRSSDPVWAAQMKTWQGGQFSKAAESIVAMQKAAAQQVWSVQMNGTAFSKVTEALAFQKFTVSVYNEKLFKGLTDFQFERAVEIAVHVLGTATGPSGMAAAGDPTSVAVDDSGHEPLMPGLVDPWQQIRHWNLATWIARPQEGIEPEDIEKIIRIMQQSSPASSPGRRAAGGLAGRAGYWSWLGVALAHKALTIFQPWRVRTSWRYST
jgi:hypothetical protein